MSTFIAAFVVLLLVVGMMSIGYWIKRRTISGSCGGLAEVGIEKACDCDKPCARRQKLMAEAAARESSD